ncbi:anaerobic ribonucleoside-triphosphate reductase activating protein [bacterium]|nr:anaerobic ribonucleoside-triphosphate reductase activating protein [bacterium]
MQFTIGGIQKTSLLDYPDKISTIVFTQGCNFNCGYCHNPSLINFKSKNDISTDVFFDFLKKRQGKLDGVVITGGEPTIQKELKPFIREIKALGFLVKLDTNGSNPFVLRELFYEKLLDYVAMDIKSSLARYSEVVGININTDNIKESIHLIMKSNVAYEFRTTVLPKFVTLEDFDKIGLLINGAKKYFLQKFEVQSEINDNSLVNEQNYSDAQFKEIIAMMKKYVNYVELR